MRIHLEIKWLITSYSTKGEHLVSLGQAKYTLSKWACNYSDTGWKNMLSPWMAWSHIAWLSSFSIQVKQLCRHGVRLFNWACVNYLVLPRGPWNQVQNLISSIMRMYLSPDGVSMDVRSTWLVSHRENIRQPTIPNVGEHETCCLKPLTRHHLLLGAN